MDWFLGVVGVVTLGLGAIGIVNIMLVSVSERTKEIGLRKALGATHRNILTQFFVEGAFLTAFSGGIGLALATGFVTLLAMLPAPEGFDTPRIIPASALAAIGSLAHSRNLRRPLPRAKSRADGAGRSVEARIMPRHAVIPSEARDLGVCRQRQHRCSEREPRSLASLGTTTVLAGTQARS